MESETNKVSGATIGETAALVQGGSSGVSRTTPPRKAHSTRGSTLQLRPGKRIMKGYPVSKNELYELGGVGLLSTLCFSTGFSYLNQAATTRRDLELFKAVKGIPDPLIARWEASSESAQTFGIIAVAIGVIAVIAGGAKIWNVINSTDHGE